jgi:ATP/maltotriose-dependent transcriptional regulator MalT
VSARVTSPVLVGRSEELRLLGGVLDRAAAGEFALAAIGGEAGIGKTRLSMLAGERARGQGFRVLTGGCLDIGESTVPYAPLLEALRQLWTELDSDALTEVFGPASGELGSLIPELGPPMATGAAPGAGRVFELVRGVLQRLARRQPTLVIIEDLHWADHATRDLLRYLSRNLRAPAALITTYRSDELPQRYPVRKLVADLHRHPGCQHLQLPPLTQTELGELADAILGHPAAPDLVRELAARAQGNPFYAEELLAARDQGMQIPEVLRNLLLLRVAELGPDVRRVLRIAAVAGTRVPHELLAAVAGQPDTVLTGLLRTAVEHHILTVAPAAGSYLFRHALLREVLYEDLLPGERQALHTAFATALAGRADGSSPAERAGELGQLAYHWHAGGHPAEALLASVQAGLAAEAASAPGDAERHFDRALQLWDQAPEAAAASPLDRHALLWRAAQTAHLAGDYARGIALIGEALAATDPDREPLQASALLTFLGYSHHAAGDIDRAEAAYNAALAAASPGPASPEQARALESMGHVFMLRDRNHDAIDTARQALDAAEQANARPTQARALNVLGHALCNLGHFTEGLGCLDRAGHIAAEAGDQATLLWTRGNVADALFDAGRAGEAVRVAAETLPMARAMGAATNYGVYFAARGAEALAWLGQWQAARQLLGELLALDPPPGSRCRPLLTSGLLRFWQGDLDTARAELTLALAGHQTVPAPATCAYARQALIAAAEHRFDAARAAVQAGLGWCTGTDGPAQISRMCLTGITIEAEQPSTATAASHTEDAAATAGSAATLIHRARSAATSGTASHMPIVQAELATAEAEWSRLHDGHGGSPERWHEAATRWEKLSFPHPAAHARRRLAEALLHSADGTSAAARELAAAYDTATMLGAGPLLRSVGTLAERARIPLPGLAAALQTGPQTGPTGNLTKRERQVLTLLADGLSNRRIAQDLFISEKTVSVHISHILAKLEVTNRTEAAAAARRINITP